MHLEELKSYRLSDAIKFHQQLNPKLWGADERLLPEVKQTLLQIARDFQEFLGVTDVEIKDITISGSNAAYTYTDHSDIDLHLVADLPESDISEVYRELFDAKKYQYNDMHDYTIENIPVELYVQNANDPHESQGIYSVQQDTWIKVPSRRQPQIDDISVQSKYEDLSHRIDSAIRTNDLDRVVEISKKIGKMRKAGLSRTGEFGPENLAFKMLRNNGTLEKLKDARQRLKTEKYSLEESASPSKMTNQFVDFCCQYLGIDQAPKVTVVRDPSWSQDARTFGQYELDNGNITVNGAGRHTMDILRTIAHELVHHRQNQHSPLPANSGKTGSPWEDSANAIAGRIMRNWAKLNPQMFDESQQEVDENFGRRARTAIAAACIAGAPGCATLDDPLKTIHAAGSTARAASHITRAGAEEELRQELKNWLRQQSGQDNHPTRLPLPKIKESSGYIPTEKERNDPRFKMALSVDVQPGQTGNEANKLGLDTDSQGRPQLLGKIKKKLSESWNQLNEVDMSPSALESWAKQHSDKIIAGFEAEMIFRDYDDDKEAELTPTKEPDFSKANEYPKNLEDAIDFFNSDNHRVDTGFTFRHLHDAYQSLEAVYKKWLDAKIKDEWEEKREQLVRQAVERDYFALYYSDRTAQDEIEIEIAEILQYDKGLDDGTVKLIMDPATRSQKKSWEKMYDAAERRVRRQIERIVKKEIRSDGHLAAGAREDFEEAKSQQEGYTEQDYLQEHDLTRMNVFKKFVGPNADWPIAIQKPHKDSFMSQKAREIGNVLNAPAAATTEYHGVPRDGKTWAIEIDNSIEPDDMMEEMGIEIVSPPMPLDKALDSFERLTAWAKRFDKAYTNESTGLHIGVSLANAKKTDTIDFVKLMLFLGDQHVLALFSRQANEYTESAMKVLDRFAKTAMDQSAEPSESAKEKIAQLSDLLQKKTIDLARQQFVKMITGTKYLSIRNRYQYVEFRAPGDDYLSLMDSEPNTIRNTILRFARAIHLAADPDAEKQEYAKKLYKLFDKTPSDILKPFVEYSTGLINRDQLKTSWAKAVVQRAAVSQPAQAVAQRIIDRPKTGKWFNLKTALSGKTVGSIFAKDLSDAQQLIKQGAFVHADYADSEQQENFLGAIKSLSRSGRLAIEPAMGRNASALRQKFSAAKIGTVVPYA